MAVVRRERCVVSIGLAAAGVALAAMLGCTTPMPAPRPDSNPAYRVGAPDSLAITILPDPPIEIQAQVRPDGMITVPLIGEVQAKDRTIPEIAAEIEERIARFKRDPHVTVALAGAASTDIVVLGEVQRQSRFPLVKETRFIEVMGLVGGPTNFGSVSRIRVFRETDGKMNKLRVDLAAIRSGDLRTNLIIQPGDFIYVPPTLYARFGYAMNALLFPFQPLLGVSRQLGANSVLSGSSSNNNAPRSAPPDGGGDGGE